MKFYKLLKLENDHIKSDNGRQRRRQGTVANCIQKETQVTNKVAFCIFCEGMCVVLFKFFVTVENFQVHYWMG